MTALSWVISASVILHPYCCKQPHQKLTGSASWTLVVSVLWSVMCSLSDVNRCICLHLPKKWQSRSTSYGNVVRLMMVTGGEIAGSIQLPNYTCLNDNSYTCKSWLSNLKHICKSSKSTGVHTWRPGTWKVLRLHTGLSPPLVESL